MPRVARRVIPELPLHVVQRGVNRVEIFVDDVDRALYLSLLDRACRDQGVAIHAYALMTNHVHLLLSAPRATAVSIAMHKLGTTYVQRFNRRHERVGTLWQGRFHSCLVGDDAYLFAVYRYIELNPVRAAMVARPEHYRWSSVHGNAGYRVDPLLTPHPTFLGLGEGEVERARRHRAALSEALAESVVREIRQHTRQQGRLGGPAPRARGRPVARVQPPDPVRSQSG